MRTFALYSAKNIGFFKIYGASARTRGVEPVRTLFGQRGEGGSIFRDFVRTAFMNAHNLLCSKFTHELTIWLHDKYFAESTNVILDFTFV